MMTYRRAFKVGDRVKIGDAMGDVIETRLQVTHIKTFKNEEIVIPNSQILSGDVINYSSFVKTQGLELVSEFRDPEQKPTETPMIRIFEVTQTAARPQDR